MSKKKLIFIYPKLYTFIHTEIKLLSDEFDLISITQNWERKILLPFNLIRQVVFLLINIRKVDTILISFGGYWSFFPALFGNLLGKKVAIVVHGTDCVAFPEIQYGNLRSFLLRFSIKKSLQWASIILPVSESLVYTENSYFTDQTLKFGYMHHLKGIKTPYKVIPNGIIINDWKRNNTIPKDDNTFITVMTAGKMQIKGGDLIIEIANKFPDHTFYFAGINSLEGVNIPKNIVCLGFLSSAELNRWYSKTQFYIQISNTEGFGVAVCEAMLCECIPIVSNVNFLPNIVAETGFVLKKRSVELLEILINKALTADLEQIGKEARIQIIENFSVENRKALLLNELKNNEC